MLLPWAGTWLEVRKKLGLDAATDGALRMARGAGGHWVARVPATATEIGSDLRRILRQCGMEDADFEGITSHSCKATLLSWAAKAGMNLEDRRLLGGHAKPGQKVTLEYSRDALAGPLERMRHVLGEIRTGGFRPDQRRASRWAPCHGLDKRPDEDVVKAQEEGEHELQEQASGNEASGSSSSGSSPSGSSSTISSEESNADVEALAALEEIAPKMVNIKVPEGFDVMHNTRSLVLHLIAKGQDEKLKCNRSVSANYKYGGKPFMLVCTTCAKNVQLLEGAVPSPTVSVGSEDEREQG